MSEKTVNQLTDKELLVEMRRLLVRCWGQAATSPEYILVEWDRFDKIVNRVCDEHRSNS